MAKFGFAEVLLSANEDHKKLKFEVFGNRSSANGSLCHKFVLFLQRKKLLESKKLVF